MKDRARVTYNYEVKGQTFTKANAIMKIKETKMLIKGESVDILVKHDTHKNAIIKHLYS